MPRRSKISTVEIINWLNSRGKDKAPLPYKVKPEDYERHKILEDIFEKFDEDKNDLLELKEVKNMFMRNSINIKIRDVKKMFNVVNKRSNSINLEQFKKFSMSTQAENGFKDIINDVAPTNHKAYFPLNFNRLMNKFYVNQQRETLKNQIQSIKRNISPENTHSITQKYTELFQLDEVQSSSLNRYNFLRDKIKRKQYKEISKSEVRKSASVQLNCALIEQKTTSECKKIIDSARKEVHEEMHVYAPISQSSYMELINPKRIIKLRRRNTQLAYKQLACPHMNHKILRSNMLGDDYPTQV